MGGISSRLRGLWREINAYGGRGKSEYDAGYERGIECALDVLEAAGFSEGKSTAADKIDADAAFMEEVREVLGSLMARVDVDRLWEQQRQGFGGGSVPEMYDAGLVPDEFLRASALLAKMEGRDG